MRWCPHLPIEGPLHGESPASEAAFADQTHPLGSLPVQSQGPARDRKRMVLLAPWDASIHLLGSVKFKFNHTQNISRSIEGERRHINVCSVCPYSKSQSAARRRVHFERETSEGSYGQRERESNKRAMVPWAVRWSRTTSYCSTLAFSQLVAAAATAPEAAAAGLARGRLGAGEEAAARVNAAAAAAAEAGPGTDSVA